MRAPLAVSVLLLLAVGACEARDPETAESVPAAGTVDQAAPQAGGEHLLTQINTRAPYAGEWAAEHGDCSDERKKWTIEPHRMAIVPAMRFCAFENVYVNRAADEGETSWSAGATCLAEGRESHDFLFFRVKENLREMRVTFNDSRSVQLYRCLS